MNDPPAEQPYLLRTTPTVKRALAESLPKAVSAAAHEFITGPLLRSPKRVGKRLLPPLDDRFSARRGTYRTIYRIDDKAMEVGVVQNGKTWDVKHRVIFPARCAAEVLPAINGFFPGWQR